VRPAQPSPDGTARYDGFHQALDLGALAPAGALRLSTAVGLSARFPVVTPVGNVVVKEPGTTPDARERVRQFADGGYFDNSGTATLAEIIAALPGSVTVAGRTVALPRIVLHFVNDPFQYRFHLALPSELPEPGIGTAQFLGPLSAILGTRSARSYSSRQVFQNAAGRSCDGDLTALAAFYLLALPSAANEPELALGWTMSDTALEDVDRKAGQAEATLWAHLEPALGDVARLRTLCGEARRSDRPIVTPVSDPR
jgi:hypothetical protein